MTHNENLRFVAGRQAGRHDFLMADAASTDPVVHRVGYEMRNRTCTRQAAARNIAYEPRYLVNPLMNGHWECISINRFIDHVEAEVSNEATKKARKSFLSLNVAP